MICRLCLLDIDELIHIFETNGDENMAVIVGKHFWFQPRKDDPISTAICSGCWLKVSEFHEFYLEIEIAHRRMTERFTVKTESEKSRRRPSLEDLIHFGTTLPSKREPNDEFDELGEVPFNMLIDDTCDEPGKTVAKAAAIALGAEDSTDIFSNPDFNAVNNHDFADKFNGHSDASFDGEEFMKKILNKTPTKTECRRSTRNAKRIQLDQSDFVDDDDDDDATKEPNKCNVNKAKKSKTLEQQEAYKIKMKNVDNEIAQYMTLHCELCNIAQDNFACLRIHMRTEHGIQKGYAKCCGKKFLKRALLLDHIRTHLDPNCYKCDQCDRTFADRQSQRNHFLIKHQREEDKIFNCHLCDKKFVRKYLLEQHKTLSHSDRSKICKACNRKFNSFEELSAHSKEHCNYGTMCDICAKVLKGPAAFKRHILEHEGVVFPKVQCDICSSWHKDKYALNKHKKRHLESRQPHVCPICNKVSPTRSAMLSHRRYVHEVARVFECGVCLKTFKKPIALREHQTIHTGEVLYKCLYCPKTFNSNANMHSHRRKVHPEEFENTRKQRLQNSHLSETAALPIISVMSNTQPLLVTQ